MAGRTIARVRRPARLRLVALSALLAGALAAPGAQATFPGVNGRIALTDQRGAFGAGETVYTLAPRRGQRPREFATGRDPAFTASGRTLLTSYFAPGAQPESGIIATPLAEPTRPYYLTASDDLEREGQPAASPSGRWFTFEADGDLRIQAAPSPDRPEPAPRRVPGTSGTCPDWSPDGRRIAYQGPVGAHLRDAIRLVTPSGRRQRTLFTQRADGPALGCPSWSPHGRYVAFSGERRGRITIMTPSGRVVRRVRHPRLPSDLEDVESLSVVFSPDGTRIAYANQLVGLHVVRLRDGRRTRICACGDDISWRPVPRR